MYAIFISDSCEVDGSGSKQQQHNPQDAELDVEEKSTPKKEFHPGTSIAALRFKSASTCDALQKTAEGLLPEIEKHIGHVSK